MTARDQQIADALGDLAHLGDEQALVERTLRALVEEAEERGREEVRVFARTRQAIEERKLNEQRRDVTGYLDPSQPVRLAASHAVDAHGHSCAVVAYRLVAGWAP